MPAFVKLGDIKGQATDADHKDWILIESMSAPISRSIPMNARDQQRTQGSTSLGDVVLVRELTTDLGTPYEGYPTWMLAVFGWGMAAVVLVLGVLTVLVRWRPETSLSPPEDVAEDEEVTP